MRIRLSALLFGALVFAVGTSAQSIQTPHTFAVSNGKFTLDGKPFQVISGEMHYPRIPRAYWRARLKMAKAMGLNSITTYVFWNVTRRSLASMTSAVRMMSPNSFARRSRRVCM